MKKNIFSTWEYKKKKQEKSWVGLNFCIFLFCGANDYKCLRGKFFSYCLSCSEFYIFQAPVSTITGLFKTKRKVLTSQYFSPRQALGSQCETPGLLCGSWCLSQLLSTSRKEKGCGMCAMGWEEEGSGSWAPTQQTSARRLLLPWVLTEKSVSQSKCS